MAKETIKKIGDKRLNLVAEASSAKENGDASASASDKATTILTVKKRKTTEDHGEGKKSRGLDS